MGFLTRVFRSSQPETITIKSSLFNRLDQRTQEKLRPYVTEERGEYLDLEAPRRVLEDALELDA